MQECHCCEPPGDSEDDPNRPPTTAGPAQGSMLHGLARMLRATAATTTGRTQRHFSVAQRLLGGTPRDYALPNASWSADTRRIYERFLELSKDGSWRRLPSYNTSVHHRDGMSVAAERRTRLFTRSLEEDGAGFEYCMFYNAEEKRTVCVFQPGPYLEGPIGYAHGGSIATIIDVTVGTGIVYGCGYALTANLSIDYRSPIPLGSTVIVDSRVDKQEGRKIYASCQVRSHDDRVLHNEATGLFIKVTRKDAEAKL